MLEFSIKSKLLADELGLLQSVAEKKTTIPILANVLIESLDNGRLRVTATDIDVTIVSDFDADITAPGAMCVSARKLSDIVRHLPKGSDIHFSQQPNFWVKLECERSNFKIAGTERDKFPETPFIPTAAVEFPASLLLNFINHTAFAITNDSSRFTLSGAKFIAENDSVTMVTTDGHRLAHAIKDAVSRERIENRVDTLIPKKALIEMCKIIKHDRSEKVFFTQDLHHIFCIAGPRRIIARKLSGSFPNYDMVFPKDNDKLVKFCANDLRNAVARVSLMSDERSNSIKMTVSNNTITIRAQSSEEGDAQESIEAEYTGDECMIGFNAKYLLDFLNLSGEEITEEEDGDKPACRRASMSFKDTNTQTLFSYENFDGFSTIIMPTRF